MLASGNEREKGKTESSQAGKFGSRYQGGHQESFHCFRCGSPDHRVRNCLERAKGIRCCNCREVGHVAARCSKPWVPGSSSSMGNALVEQGAMDGGVKGYEARTSGSNMTPEEFCRLEMLSTVRRPCVLAQGS